VRARSAGINVVEANRMVCVAESSATVTMLWKQRRRSRQATDALSVVDGGVGALGASGGGRDQAMRPRVRQRASEEAALAAGVVGMGGGMSAR
jgi:hypothetical protein